MDKVEDVLSKLQDVNSGAIMASLKQRDVLMYQPDEGSMTLHQLQGDHGDVPRLVQQRRAADVQAAAGGADDVNHERTGAAQTLPIQLVPRVIPVTQGGDNVEAIKSSNIKQGKCLRRRKVGATLVLAQSLTCLA